MPNGEPKIVLAMIHQETNELTQDQVEILKRLADRVRWDLKKPCRIVSEPVTIEGCKVISQTEENGMIIVEIEWPEGVDLEDLKRIFGPFGPIDPEQDFMIDYDQGD